MVANHGSIAGDLGSSRPEPNVPGKGRGPEEHGVSGTTHRPPDAVHPPPPCGVPELDRVCLLPDQSDIDQVEDSPKRRAFPGVGGQHERVVRRRERKHAADSRRRIHRLRKQFSRGRRWRPLRPHRASVQLKQYRQSGQPERAEVMLILVGAVIHADGHETRRDERPLSLVGPIDEQVDVAERTQRRARVTARHLEPFHQDKRAVVRGARPLQGDLRGKRYRGGETFVGGELLRDGISEGAKAPRGEQVEAVCSEVDRARRAFDDVVDGSPERVVPDLTFGPLLGPIAAYSYESMFRPQ